MRWLDALSAAMGTWRTSRISRSEADRLIDGRPPADPRHTGLAELLAAAAAPSGDRAGERDPAGERAAVAAFVRARRDGAPTAVPPRGRRRLRPPATRTTRVRVAAATAVLVAGGTAAAAKTGVLPDGAQRTAHTMFAALGVPAPAHPSATRSAAAGPARPSPARPPNGTGDHRPGPVWACLAWEAVDHDGHGGQGRTPPFVNTAPWAPTAPRTGGATPPGKTKTKATADAKTAKPGRAAPGATAPNAAATPGAKTGRALPTRSPLSLSPQALRALTTEAGGAQNIGAYCARVLDDARGRPSTAGHPAPQRTTSAPPPSRPPQGQPAQGQPPPGQARPAGPAGQTKASDRPKGGGNGATNKATPAQRR